jgi:hypothetical protein
MTVGKQDLFLPKILNWREVVAYIFDRNAFFSYCFYPNNSVSHTKYDWHLEQA